MLEGKLQFCQLLRETGPPFSTYKANFYGNDTKVPALGMEVLLRCPDCEL